MANNDLALRFTEEKYATRTEVMRDLKTSLVDHIWANILAYRKGFNVVLSLNTFNKSKYTLCNCQYIDSKNTLAEMRFLRVMKEASTYTDKDYTTLERMMYQSLLKYVARKNNLDDSDIRMRAIMNNEIKNLDDTNSILPYYIEALQYVKKNYARDIDINVINEIYELLTNSIAGYRNQNDTDHANKVLIDRIYTSAPVTIIEPLMIELCSFINESTLNPLLKAYTAYYYLTMVKPFPSYSEEVALLVAKGIIAKESMGEVATILPLEILLTKHNEEMERLYSDVQRYNDVTYFVKYCLELSETVASEALNKILSFKANEIKKDLYQEDPVPVNETPVVEEVKPTPTVQLVETNEKLVEEVEVAPKVEVKKEIKQPAKEVTKTIRIVEPVNEEQQLNEIAISYIPRGLDEREATRLETHLLELDPSLKKGEARFYARHCTLGKMYTIQQFKKCNGCAYETARTGMEHLVSLGYYRKEQIKNKFVYTPINRR